MWIPAGVKAIEICKGSMEIAGCWFLHWQKLLDLFAEQVTMNCDHPLLHGCYW